MNSAPRPTRARRGRLLVVGDIPELERLVAHAPPSGEPARANNLFEALGEIATAPAAAPIATVVLCDRHMPTHPGRAIESLHKIDPSLRIVMITHPDSGDESANDPPRDWLALGVDECIAAPVAAHDLARIFEENLILGGPGASDSSPASRDEDSTAKQKSEPAALADSTTGVGRGPLMPGSAAMSVHEIPEAVRTVPPQSRSAPAPPAAAAAAGGPAPAPPPRSAVAASAPQPPSSAAAPSGSAPAPTVAAAHLPAATEQSLGDTDLVEAILAGPNRLTPIALQLIAQQTGWHDIALITEPTDSSPVVALGERQFAWLATSRASASAVKPWADWLARWLALDESYHGYRLQAMQDDLTGAGNRRYFDEFLRESIKRAARLRRPVTLMVFDIDNFKSYNDQFGHEAGDDVLRDTVRLMQSVIRQGDRVCRIGGDEFAVIFADEEAPREPGSRHPESIEAIAKRFQDQICQMRFPKLGPEAPGTLTISAGLATYPWDGADPASLLRHADQLALESKRKGKNVITFGKGAMRACRPEE